MKPKNSVDPSKIKIRPDEDYKPKMDASKSSKKKIFKKVETPFIIFGAGLLGFILVYLFLTAVTGVSGRSIEKNELADRVLLLEKKLASIDPESGSPGSSPDTKELVERFDKFEATVSLKLNVMEKKFEDLWDKKSKTKSSLEFSKPEKSISALNEKINPEPANAVKKEEVSAQSEKEKKRVSLLKKTEKNEPVYHEVKKGQTFYSISRTYSLTVQELLDLNRLKNGATIYPGQKLLVKP